MKEKKADKKLVKEVVNDPAFYNDQIDKNKEPARELYPKNKENKH